MMRSGLELEIDEPIALSAANCEAQLVSTLYPDIYPGTRTALLHSCKHDLAAIVAETNTGIDRGVVMQNAMTRSNCPTKTELRQQATTYQTELTRVTQEFSRMDMAEFLIHCRKLAGIRPVIAA